MDRIKASKLERLISALGPWYQEFVIDGIRTTNRPLMSDSMFDRIAPLIPDKYKKKKVLDLGCNAGLVSFKLAGMGAKVYGFDKYERHIDQANFVMKYLDLPRVRFIISNVDRLAINAYSPALIIALSSLYHLDDPTAAIKKMCAENCDMLVSFRLNLYDGYIAKFKEFGRLPIGSAEYGRKRAAFFKAG